MEAKANYTVVGMVVLILTSALLATALWLSVGFNNKSYNNYVVYMHEAVGGLSDDAKVKFNGVDVGYVKQIQLNHRDPQQVVLILAVEDGTPITASTYATLISQGITGVTYVGLAAENEDLSPLKKKKGEAYPVIPSKPSLFNQLDKALKDVSQNVNKVSVEISRVFDKENALAFKKTLANVEKFSNTLSKNSEQVSHMISRTNVFMDNMSKASKDIPELIDDLKFSVNKIKGMAKDMSIAGKSVSATMKTGKITIEQISQQTLPTFMKLLQRLNHVSANLEDVSSKLKQNPSIIIRGTKGPRPGPGER